MKRSTAKLLSLPVAALLSIGMLASCDINLNINFSKKSTDEPFTEALPDDVPGSNESEDSPGETKSETLTDGTETDTPETETADIPDVPAGLDFEGEEVEFLIPTLYQDEIIGNENDRDLLSQRNFYRNKEVEGQLNLQMYPLVQTATGAASDYAQTVRKMFLSGTKPDLVSLPSSCSLLATEGFFYNLGRDDAGNYTELSQPWYNSYFTASCGTGGYVPFVVGDLNISAYSRSSIVFFNKNRLAESGFTNLAQIVLSGNWTAEKLCEAADVCYADLNGDGLREEGDRFGLAFNSVNDVGAMLMGLGFRIAGRIDTEGAPVPLLQSNPKQIDRVKILTVFLAEGFRHPAPATSDVGKNAFMNDRAVFLIGRMDCGKEFANAKLSFQYGFLPLPKCNEEQSEYLTTPITFSMTAVAKTTQPEKATATLELLYYNSYCIVRPTYQELCSYRYSTATETGQVLPLILDGITFDLATVYRESVGYPLTQISAILANSGSLSDYLRYAHSVTDTLGYRLFDLNNRLLLAQETALLP